MTPAQMIQMAVTGKVYPQHLFKYRSHNDFTENIVTKNELWFSNPLVFNDPYDCNVPINSSTPLPEIKAWLKAVGVHDKYVDEFATRVQRTPHIMREQTESAMGRLGVCCFSTLPDSFLQWSHYSDYHRGICLKFDITQDPEFFMVPIIVSYRKVMQHYNHFTQSQNLVEYLIKPKYDDWSYESEVRVVKQHAGPEVAKAGDKAYRFNDAALTEIIFGAKTSPDVIDRYKGLCAAHNKSHVTFAKMELGSGVHYELVKTAV